MLTEEKTIWEYKANKIKLKLICQLCKLACFNHSLHPNSWNNLKAFFPLSLRVINERSWLLIKLSWSVVKREDRRWAWSCLFSLNPNTAQPELNYCQTNHTWPQMQAHRLTQSVSPTHHHTKIKIQAEVDKHIGSFKIVPSIEWLTRLLIWCDIINYSLLSKQMGQRVCGKEMSVRIINLCGWVDQASP